MPCPGKIHVVVRQFQKAGTEFTNEQILTFAAGGAMEWDEYLQGPKVQAVVRSANLILIEQNCEIVSLGIGSRRWRMVTCAEARVEQAYQQTTKAANHLLNAEENLWKAARDERAHPRLRADARAWLELFNDDRVGGNLLIFEEWAEELLKKLPPPPKNGDK